MGWITKLLWDNDEETDVPGEFGTEDEAFQFGADWADDFYGGEPDIETMNEDEPLVHVYRKRRKGPRA